MKTLFTMALGLFFITQVNAQSHALDRRQALLPDEVKQNSFIRTLLNPKTKQLAQGERGAGIWIPDFRLTYFPGSKGTWDLVFRNQYTYENSTELVEDMEQFYLGGDDWLNSQRQLFSKGVIGNLNFETTLRQFYDGMNWVNTSMDSVYTNASGREIRWVEYGYQDMTWELQDGSIIEETLDAGLLIQMEISQFNSFSGVFEPAERLVFDYAPGTTEPGTAYGYLYDGIWILDYRAVDLTWHDFALFLPTAVTFQFHVGGNEFENAFRQTAVYDDMNRELEMVFQMWDFEESIWMNDFRFTQAFDDWDTILEERFYFWDGGGWLIDGGTNYLNTYDDNNNLAEQEVSYYDEISGWEPSIRYTWSYNDVSSTGTAPMAQAWQIFPNPAVSTLGIMGQGQVLRYFEVYDITGKMVLQGQPSAAEMHQISIVGWPTGVYLLRMHTDAGILVKKFVKE
jgi:hypothetical protein